MKPDQILDVVCRSADALLAAYEPYGGMLPSLLDRATGRMLANLPAPIPGQRNADRSGGGCNLIHDEPLLLTLPALTAATGRPRYAAMAENYVRRFALHCTDTVSGLFPWGEHAYWDLTRDCIGDSYLHHDPRRSPRPTHDHLRAAPQWLWMQLWQANPSCVLRFAEGLDNHWTAGGPDEPREYIRHALIQDRRHYPRDLASADFPRHSGFYIYDLAVAFAMSRNEALLRQLREFADYWWQKRDASNLCLLQSRTPDQPAARAQFHVASPGQTLSLAVSLAEAAVLLAAQQPQLASMLRERATAYIDGFFAAPHDLERGVFLLSLREDGQGAMAVWGSEYGQWPAAYVALFALCGYRLTHDPRLLNWAASVGRAYGREPMPASTIVPAMDAGLAVGLLADLFDITGDAAWRDAAVALAADLIPRYLDRPIPRGATGIDWYESQMGPGFLLHGLARTALLAMDRSHCPLAADYTAR